MIPERLLDIVRNTPNETRNFPATLFYNEGWMLRLLLDAYQSEGIQDHPFTFEAGAHWYSEARLPSPFSAEKRGDGRGEGSTCADGTLGHFHFREGTTAGLALDDKATQFVVVEAKMGSKLSAGTSNAAGYNQAARNVACMAEAIHRWAFPKDGKSSIRVALHSLEELSSLGFYVIVPQSTKKSHEPSVEEAEIRDTVTRRMERYGGASEERRRWHDDYFTPFLERIAKDSLKVLTWECCIQTVTKQNPVVGEELSQFYETCLTLAI